MCWASCFFGYGFPPHFGHIQPKYYSQTIMQCLLTFSEEWHAMCCVNWCLMFLGIYSPWISIWIMPQDELQLIKEHASQVHL